MEAPPGLRIAVRAPVRIDLAGGTLDIWPLHLILPEPAVTVNAALDLPARATVTRPDAGGVAIRLASRDQGREEAHADLDALAASHRDGRSTLPLLAEAVLAVGPRAGLTLTTDAGSPAGAGLGGSSALLCAALAALLAAEGRRLAPMALQALAQDVETRVLRKPTGYQDYLPPLFGGCLAIEGAPGGLQVETLPTDLAALERRLRLVYTGAPHESGLTNWGVVRAYLDGESATIEALHETAAISRAVRAHLRAGDLDAALRLVIADGALRRRMAPGVSTPAIEALDEAARRAGALGTKVLGAGGGGCVLIVLEAGASGAEVDALLQAGPGRPIPLHLDPRGLGEA
jgi:D-glycero-alpha-D-manno-heptose-7-phosphate kinase